MKSSEQIEMQNIIVIIIIVRNLEEELARSNLLDLANCVYGKDLRISFLDCC